MANRTWYAIHRWLSALVGLQLVAWSAGGLIFSTHSIAWVRGEKGRRADRRAPIPLDRVRVTPAAAGAAAKGEVLEIELRALLGEPIYEVRTTAGPRLVDAVSGAVRPPLGEAEAVAVARADREGPPEVSSAELVERAAPMEYRGQPLPAWRVVFADDDQTHVWVDATTGQIRARRNAAWRRYDFFWMLHTMDYRGRDDFNRPILVAFAATGLCAVLAGWALWGLRLSHRWWRSRYRS